MINIDTIKDRFQLRFADDFFEELGREKGYKMMSLFECKRKEILKKAETPIANHARAVNKARERLRKLGTIK